MHILRKEIHLLEIPNLDMETTTQISKTYIKEFNLNLQPEALQLLIQHYNYNMALIIAAMSCLKQHKKNTLLHIKKLTQHVHCNYTTTGLTSMIENIFECNSIETLRKFHDEDRGMMGLMFHENMLGKIRNKLISKMKNSKLYQVCLENLCLGEFFEREAAIHERHELLDYSIVVKLYYPFAYI